MIAADTSSGSTNNDPGRSESSPITGSASANIFRKFGSIFQNASQANNAQYIEFGSITENNTNRTLGTFSGVFCPVTLSMFSALLFIRVGFIVGNAGLYVTLMQFLIAYVILLFSVSSVCAISTNGAVEGGGVYFMISRTLGLEFGGSIGTLFFLANIVGCALAISGCTEGLIESFGINNCLHENIVIENCNFLPDGRWWRFLYCSAINSIMLIVCLLGASLFAKTSVITLAIVFICLMSSYISFVAVPPRNVTIPEENIVVQNQSNPAFGIYTGISLKTLKANLESDYSKDYTSNGNNVNFAIVFGVLFSGVTGIYAGANMSGELKNPSKSIPSGTISAVVFTFFCYVLLSFGMASTSSRFLLQNNFLFLASVNIWPTFVILGILTATFSTGLSNLIGSSRVLEALAKDQVYGPFLNFVVKGTVNNNPIAAVGTSWFLVELILLIGSLNTIAQINSVLFLLAYLATNLACLGIEVTGAPNFRPTYKYFTWHTAFFGLLGTGIMMFLINPIYASSSIILCLLLVITLHLFSPASQGAQWGSISQALMFHQVRKYLLMLDSRKDHVKFWRPQMLLLVSSPRSCCPLIDFVNHLKKGGLYIIGHVKIGEFSDVDANDPTIEEHLHWLEFIDHMKVKAFVELTLANTIRNGVQQLIRISGMGAMKPNTIILGYYDEEISRDFLEDDQSPYGRTRDFCSMFPPFRQSGEDKNLLVDEYVSIINDVLKMRKNICLCRHFHRFDKTMIARSNHIKYIDVWPVNFFEPKSDNPFDVVSLFMMQLACIINMLPLWKKLQLRVFLCGEQTEQQPQLNQLLESLRIKAVIHVLPEWILDTTDNRNRAQQQLSINNANQMIRDKSNQTAITFMYLPSPKLSTKDYVQKATNYLDLLTQLTFDLPPTILVHGVNSVISTAL